MNSPLVRHNWTYEEVHALYSQPFLDLLLQAQQLHRQCFPANEIQAATLFNIKRGGCPEDCAWCGQSVYNETGVTRDPIATTEEVVARAKLAKDQGATRFCLAAAWRSPTESNFEKTIDMVKGIKSLGLEACITVGQLKPEHAKALKEAGLDFYNHNLETSEKHFSSLTTTRTYQDRLTTVKNVREAGINVCCGGILGMGEKLEDRLELLITLANLPEHPESVPINHLVSIPGTPLENAPKIPPLEFVRCVAVARIMMPYSYVRLSGGRVTMSDEQQALCFMAGANSIHMAGKMLLVTPNVDVEEDYVLLNNLGISLQGSPKSALKVSKNIPCVTNN